MSLIVRHLSVYHQQQAVVQQLSFTVQASEVLCVMGASGSGKSSMLAAINGELQPPSYCTGEVLVNGEPILTKPLGQRRVGLLHQQEMLFPHFNVAQNLAFAVPAHYSKAQRKQKVAEALQRAQLADYAKVHINTLSGGQYARIAMMRTILCEPHCLLLDEPFANLDRNLKVSFRQWLKQLAEKQHIPMLIVSHDNQDAISNNILHLS